MWGAIIAAVAGIVSIIISSEAQKDSNREIAEFQAASNERYQAQQNAYNSPLAQMGRFKEAGLNPHLIYGSGSASAGNQASPLTFPDIKPRDLMGAGRDIGNSFQQVNQARLMDAQIDATNATTRQRTAQVELNKLQAQVIAKNPLLDDAGYKATIDGLIAAAALKKEQTRATNISNFISDSTAADKIAQIWKETELLDQRFKLSKLDGEIKAQVLKSKEFQNAILEVQKKFMVDADITPQHMLQFVQLILMKSL